ncbi:cell division protein pelota [Pyrobaculum islandicum DSM 4184]|uniref:Protein pelota homolog n=1 Tax=Pyrobaculum islandicum (strain DSM 4184 / JCM 9189 / GEO3) TaxID=384616 RepID=PELO_PYRIL|nr:pelota family protein [Pyrobaculum islandicum]A1RRT7.1 RecName: Full=Protein pelota homolog [Pyrobaculum islandicum DSM 4184]ABL87669.1 cell division protein pelota [Pyrobaculum islandicum DSM 4184]
MRYEVDTKRRIIKLVPEREEDLYFIYLLIDKGDIIRGWTVREYKPDGVKEGERIKIYLAIKVESLEYHKFRGSLRIRGTVVEVQDGIEGVKGRRHTFDVTPGREIEIEKAYDYPLDVVIEVLNMAKAVLPRVLLISVDDEETVFAYITALGVEILHTMYNTGRKDDSMFEEYFTAIKEVVDELKRRHKPDIVVLAGPSMIIEQASEYIQAIKVPQGSGGLAGVYEFIRGGLYEKFKIEMGINVYQRFIHKLSVDRLSVAIGLNEVREATDAGRIETVLVLDTLIKERPEDIWPLLAQVYKTRGKIHIVKEDSEVGAGLKAMGGVVALLRW